MATTFYHLYEIAKCSKRGSRAGSLSFLANLCNFSQVQRRLNQSDTRKRHTKTFRPIRKAIDGGSVPLPIEKLEKLPSDARQQSRLSKASFRIYNGESYKQDTNINSS